jgi:predicted amidohydrolase
MKITLILLDQFWEDKQKNINACEIFIRKASNIKSELIIFPEMTLTGFSMNIEKIGEIEEESFTINKFKNLSRRYNIAIIFGVVIKKNEKAENRLVFLNNGGEILETYTKIHPFTFAEEDKFYDAGSQIKSTLFKRHRVGLTICYDLRFPDIYSALSTNCDIIVNIANWPAIRKSHWKTLLKARAIENQIFIIGVNRVGVDSAGRNYDESTVIINANGEELDAKIEKNMKTFLVDKNWTKNFKDNFNTTNDRRDRLYIEMKYVKK